MSVLLDLSVAFKRQQAGAPCPLLSVTVNRDNVQKLGDQIITNVSELSSTFSTLPHLSASLSLVIPNQNISSNSSEPESSPRQTDGETGSSPAVRPETG